MMIGKRIRQIGIQWGWLSVLFLGCGVTEQDSNAPGDAPLDPANTTTEAKAEPLNLDDLFATSDQVQDLTLHPRVIGAELRTAPGVSNTFGWAFSPDGKRLYALVNDKGVAIYNPETYDVQSIWGVEDAKLWRLALSHDGSTLATANNLKVLVWDTKTGKVRVEFDQIEGLADPIHLSPDGKTAIASNESLTEYVAWNTESSDILWRHNTYSENAQPASFSPDGKVVAVRGENGDVELLDPATGKARHTIAVAGEQQQNDRTYVTHICYSPNGKQLAIAAIFDVKGKSMTKVCLLSTSDYQPLWVATIAADHPALLRFTSDGKALAVGTRAYFQDLSGPANFWNVSDGSYLFSIEGLGFEPFPLAPCGGKLIASKAYDGALEYLLQPYFDDNLRKSLRELGSLNAKFGYHRDALVITVDKTATADTFKKIAKIGYPFIVAVPLRTKIEAGDLAVLGTSEKFVGLNLSSWNGINDENVMDITSLTSMQYLDLNNSNWLTDDGIPQLQALTELRELHMHDFRKMTGAALAHLGTFENVEVLDLSENKLRDGDFSAISTLPKLRELNLTKTELTDESVEQLANIKSLESLRVSDNHELTAAAVVSISKIDTLQILDLSSTELRDDALTPLERSKNLRILNLSGTNTSQEQKTKLQAAIPNLTILDAPW